MKTETARKATTEYTGAKRRASLILRKQAKPENQQASRHTDPCYGAFPI